MVFYLLFFSYLEMEGRKLKGTHELTWYFCWNHFLFEDKLTLILKTDLKNKLQNFNVMSMLYTGISMCFLHCAESTHKLQHCLCYFNSWVCCLLHQTLRVHIKTTAELLRFCSKGCQIDGPVFRITERWKQYSCSTETLLVQIDPMGRSHDLPITIYFQFTPQPAPPTGRLRRESGSIKLSASPYQQQHPLLPPVMVNNINPQQ